MRNLRLLLNIEIGNDAIVDEIGEPDTHALAEIFRQAAGKLEEG